MLLQFQRQKMAYQPEYSQIIHLQNTRDNSEAKFLSLPVTDQNRIFISDFNNPLLFSIEKISASGENRFKQHQNTIDYGENYDCDKLLGIICNPDSATIPETYCSFGLKNDDNMPGSAIIAFVNQKKDSSTAHPIGVFQANSWLSMDGRLLFWTELDMPLTGLVTIYYDIVKGGALSHKNKITDPNITFANNIGPVKRSFKNFSLFLGKDSYFATTFQLYKTDISTNPPSLKMVLNFKHETNVPCFYIFDNDYEYIYIATDTNPYTLWKYDIKTEVATKSPLYIYSDNDDKNPLYIDNACMNPVNGNILVTAYLPYDASQAYVLSIDPENGNNVEYCYKLPIGRINDIVADKDGYVYVTGTDGGNKSTVFVFK
jgi:hypothetical protein